MCEARKARRSFTSFFEGWSLRTYLAMQALDEADTMFDRGFGPEVRKFLGPLRNRSSQPGGTGFQTVLVTATITKVCLFVAI